MSILDKITSYFHVCYYVKPIVSKYVSFNTRDIIFECKCGKRICKRITNAFDAPFPMPTNTFMTDQEFEKLKITFSINSSKEI